MSEIATEDLRFDDVPSLTETDDDVIKPNSPDTATESADDLPAEPVAETAAERVRRRLAGGSRAGRKTSSESDTKTQSTPRATLPKPREGSLVKPLTQMYVSVGLMMQPFDPNCSAAIIQNAERCAKSVEALARENEAVRRVINSLLQTSAWGGVLMAHLPILLMLTVHHGPKQVAESVAPMAQMLNTPGAFDTMGDDLPKEGDAA